MASVESHAGFKWRRLLRRGRFALLLGWLALSIGAFAHADCAIPLLAGSAPQNVANSSARARPAAQQPTDSDDDDAGCEQLLAAMPMRHATVAIPTDDTGAHILSEPAPEVVLPHGDAWPALPAYPLYLRTSRLLI